MRNQSWRIALSIVLLGSLVSAADHNRNITSVQTVSTALDHLTVLEFDEAVKQAAIGSSSFQVERESNKVFIKPLKNGAATNLFVWTESNQRYAYELSVGDVSQMDAQIHVATNPAPQPDKTAEIEKASEMAVSRAVGDIRRVDASSIKTPRGKIGIRVEEIVRSGKTIYIRYAIENRRSTPYQLTAPALYQLHVDHPAVNLTTLKGKQVDPRIIAKNLDEARVLVATLQNSAEEQVIEPGERKEGVLAIPRTDSDDLPSVLELILPDDVHAVIVL